MKKIAKKAAIVKAAVKCPKGYRVEEDSLGQMFVPANKFWGSQTQRSIKNFKISDQKVSLDLIHAFALVKHAAATANEQCGKLDHKRAEFIRKACIEVFEGKLDDNFPTNAYQAGAGTQTNMNVNEVIARRASFLAGQPFGYIHENDHVNMSQSTNDAYPTSANLCVVDIVERKLIPSVEGLIGVFKKLEAEHKNLVKLGRTHIQDAIPLTFGQEVSGWRFACENALAMIKNALAFNYVCTMGATAVGTGLTCPLNKGYAKKCNDALNKLLAKYMPHLTRKFTVCPNLFYSTWSKDGYVFLSGAIKALAMNLYKISMDVRFLASGPRCGFGEINIPRNEPGSSIMPGKVNPTQCEGMSMMCVDVVGKDLVVSWLAGGANFELNTFGTIQMANLINMVDLFSNYINSFNKNCCAGITVNKKKMEYFVNNSLILVTCLKDVIGYHKCAEIGNYAFENGTSLKEAAMKLGYINEKDYDKYVVPAKMCHN